MNSSSALVTQSTCLPRTHMDCGVPLSALDLWRLEKVIYRADHDEDQDDDEEDGWQAHYAHPRGISVNLSMPPRIVHHAVNNLPPQPPSIVEEENEFWFTDPVVASSFGQQSKYPCRDAWGFKVDHFDNKFDSVKEQYASCSIPSSFISFGTHPSPGHRQPHTRPHPKPNGCRVWTLHTQICVATSTGLVDRLWGSPTGLPPSSSPLRQFQHPYVGSTLGDGLTGNGRLPSDSRLSRTGVASSGASCRRSAA